MKKSPSAAAIVLLTLSMLNSCSQTQTEAPGVTEPSESLTESAETFTEPDTAPTEPSVSTESAAPSADTTPAKTEANPQPAGIPSSAFADTPYAQQIERYDTALSNHWDENTYFEHEMSPMAIYYYEGNALDNVGFTFLDLDGDDIQELFIGAILSAEKDPLVFEIWTLQNGEPVMLAQSGSHNRYYMQYAEEDKLWSIAYEAENGAANHAVHYLQLSDGKLEVIQGILFDAIANENEPWFMAYDLDWDSSNDMSIDEDTAIAVMNAARNTYTNMEYIPYSRYK